MKGIDLIAKELQDQITKHGRTVLSDVRNNENHQLTTGAIGLLAGINEKVIPNGWDVDSWSKMCNKSRRDRLIIAGALIAAEINRLDYSNEVVG